MPFTGYTESSFRDGFRVSHVRTAVFAANGFINLARDHPWSSIGSPPIDTRYSVTLFDHVGIRTDVAIDFASVSHCPVTRAARVPYPLAPVVPIVPWTAGTPVFTLLRRVDGLRVALGSSLWCDNAQFSGSGTTFTSSVVAYDCESRPGDCGSPVLCARGVVGIHAGTDPLRNVNLFIPCTHPSSVRAESLIYAIAHGGDQRPSVKKLAKRLGATKIAKSTPPRPVPRSSPPPAPVKQRASAVSYAAEANARSLVAVEKKVGTYMGMVIDPFSADTAVRYPDDTIVATALAHLNSALNFTVTSDATFVTMLKWKHDYLPADGLITYASNPITPPQALSLIDTGVSFMGNNVSYGAPALRLTQTSAVDRTLALGVRVRLNSMPPSTFMPSGTVYFLQMQLSELLSFMKQVQSGGTNSESLAVQAVSANKGFSVSVNDISKTGGVSIPYLPQGPMSYLFSDTNTDPAAVAGLNGKVNPLNNYVPSTVVSANGALVVLGFGLQTGSSFRFDYAHHVEYIPNYVSAGTVTTAVELPSSSARDAIAAGAQAVSISMNGSTSLSEAGPCVTGISSAGPSLGKSIAKSVLGLFPGGSAISGAMSAGASLNKSLGGPAWLSSALGILD